MSNLNRLVIVNPSQSTNVFLKAGQEFLLKFDLAQFVDVRIIVESDLLEQTNSRIVENHYEHVFVQSKDLSIWAKYSTCFLGQIWICPKNEERYRISLILNCEKDENSHFITVIDPQNIELKIRPHNILELVIPQDLNSQHISILWTPLHSGVKLVQTDWRYMTAQATGVGNGYSGFKIIPRLSKTAAHHFFFSVKLDQPNILVNSGIFKNYAYTGDLTCGETISGEPRIISVYLKAKQKDITSNSIKLWSPLTPNISIATFDPRVRHVTITRLPTNSIGYGCTTIPAVQSLEELCP